MELLVASALSEETASPAAETPAEAAVPAVPEEKLAEAIGKCNRH